jgi:hypothetical protein
VVVVVKWWSCSGGAAAAARSRTSMWRHGGIISIPTYARMVHWLGFAIHDTVDMHAHDLRQLVVSTRCPQL